MDDEGATHSPVWGVSDLASGHHLSSYYQRDEPSHHRPAQHSIKSELTESPDFRILRPSTELPRQPSFPSTSTQAAISASYNTRNISNSQDVRQLVNSSATYLSAPVTRTDAFSHILGPTVSSSPTTPSHHVLTHRRQRPRTSNQVFTAPHGTIAPHGLPQSLPPAPSTAPRRTQQTQEQDLSEFSALSQNYLNMLRQKPTDNIMDADNTTVASTEVSDFRPEDVQSIIDVITGEYLVFDDDDDQPSDSSSGSASSSMLPPPTPQTPELWSSPAWSDTNDFNTFSPDTDLLNTPLFADDDALTGMFDCDSFEGGALFPAMEEYAYEKPVQSGLPSLPDADQMFTFTPESPALHDFSSTVNPSTIYPSPRVTDLSTFSPAPPPVPQNFGFTAPSQPAPKVVDDDVPQVRRRTSATGTRKGVTPEALVPIDAPTQPRKYVMPSATSRKEVPSVFAKKRSRSTAFGEEDDEFNEPPLAANATEKEQIEYKRRQNTVAARRSRKRKLEYQQNLEDQVERLKRERDVWKTRATMCQEMLTQSGLSLAPFPEFHED
ncbi:hypothetical protein DXG01_011374 [Tephrocybe rancida]|nr:hypothetical protein DXG01_011374 [Tephrocybe rancida]